MVSYHNRVLDTLQTRLGWALGLLALDVVLLARVLYLLGGV